MDADSADFRLSDSSSCIDAGKDTLGVTSTDIIGTTRDANPDMGAYEYPVGGYAKSSRPWIADETTKPSAVNLGTPKPNPFNSTVSVDFKVNETSEVDISIYSISGRKVKTLLRDRVSQGHWETIWNGTDDSSVDMPSGVYLIKLTVDGQTVKSKTVSLVK